MAITLDITVIVTLIYRFSETFFEYFHHGSEIILNTHTHTHTHTHSLSLSLSLSPNAYIYIYIYKATQSLKT